MDTEKSKENHKYIHLVKKLVQILGFSIQD